MNLDEQDAETMVDLWIKKPKANAKAMERVKQMLATGQLPKEDFIAYSRKHFKSLHETYSFLSSSVEFEGDAVNFNCSMTAVVNMKFFSLFKNSWPIMELIHYFLIRRLTH